jgi:Ca2+-binding EF-hand superfamily protein
MHMAHIDLPVSVVEVEEYYEAFHLFDRDNSGNISTNELGNVMRSLGENPTSMELEVKRILRVQYHLIYVRL